MKYKKLLELKEIFLLTNLFLNISYFIIIMVCIDYQKMIYYILFTLINLFIILIFLRSKLMKKGENFVIINILNIMYMILIFNGVLKC